MTVRQLIDQHAMTDNPTNHPPRPAHDIITALATFFPQAFIAEKWQPQRPLKIGIHIDLLAAGIMTSNEIWAALRSYARRRMYLAAVAAGGPRIDLNGNPAGEVTAAEAAWAQQQLDQLDAAAGAEAAAAAAAAAVAAQRQAKQKAASLPLPAQVSRDKPHVQPQTADSVQRDSITALRAAAAARRAVAVAKLRDKLIA
jgi:ProP effector